MTYVQGFVTPVKPGRRDAYLEMAKMTGVVLRDYGALRIVECLEADVRDGETTDFRRAVNAEPGETIAFSWIVWPDRATCDAAAEKMQSDTRLAPPDGGLPFDAARLVYGGFTPAYDEGEG